jgi:DNA-binding PadR family transcriptional regulator
MESFGKKELSATQLRSQLVGTWGGVGPQFYQAMRRLQMVGAIDSRKQAFDVGGGEVTRTYYSLTGAGREAWQEVVDFYRKRGV